MNNLRAKLSCYISNNNGDIQGAEFSSQALSVVVTVYFSILKWFGKVISVLFRKAKESDARRLSAGTTEG